MDTLEEIKRKAYEDFIARLALLEERHRTFTHAWKTTALSAADELTCPGCRIDLRILKPSQRYTTFLVPPLVGGPATFQNSVLMCASCGNKRGFCDITDPLFTSRLKAPLPTETLARRVELLLHGQNHLTSTWPMAPKETVQALLEKRYEHPRFRVFAHASSLGCYVGFRRRKSEPQAYAGAAALLRHVHKASVEERGDLVIFQLEHRAFLPAVWEMIETNGLVVPIDLADRESNWNTVDPLDWRKCWREIYDRFDDNRRRYRTRQTRQPWAPRTLSENKDSVRSRARGDRLLRDKNQRRLELRRAKVMDENYARWSNDDDFGYQFRPSSEQVWHTFQEAQYWRLKPHQRRVFLLDNPGFKAPSLDDGAS